jgi:hypothetical protein
MCKVDNSTAALQPRQPAGGVDRVPVKYPGGLLHANGIFYSGKSKKIQLTRSFCLPPHSRRLGLPGTGERGGNEK